MQLTDTHLVILMEYADGGELFQRVCDAGNFTESEARFYFQQLVSGYVELLVLYVEPTD